MNLNYEHLPVIIVALLLLAAFLEPIVYRHKKSWAAPLVIASMAFFALSSLYLMAAVNYHGPFNYYLGGWAPPFGIELEIDYLAVFLLLTFSVIGLIAIVYGLQDLKHGLKDEVLGWYFTLYLLLMASMAGISVTNDLFNMYVFVEISAISACAIISIKESRECIEASLKYLILSTLGSGCILLATAMLYMITGHLNIGYLNDVLPRVMSHYPNNILISLGFFVVGYGVKAALFPLHVWLPDAHTAAPSPSSAVLSGLVIKVYAAAFLKVFLKAYPREIFLEIPVMEIVLFLSVLAILYGSIVAMVQEDIKKMLAYSSIAQIGYVFLGFSLMGQRAVAGGLLHIFNHAMMKSMLFLAAGIIIYSTGIRRIRDMKGLGVKLPLTMGAFTIGALSMVGIPGTNGFISKWQLALGALDLGRPIIVVVILLSSLLNCLYYMPIVINAFFGVKGEPELEIGKVPGVMLYSILFLGFGIIFFGIYPAPLLAFLQKTVTAIL
ncbi:MAG: monovalent cation/H+ antiporter subunit D family protein [Firmicutes bacterium]|nr:monovalent cation/H+ antiporter subunit D family protein [Bacillota bacterium]